MSILKTKPVAILIAAVLVISTTFLGAKISLEEEGREVADLFYEGVERDGYFHPSIYSQLEIRADAANGLASVARNHGLESACEDIVRAREFLFYSGGAGSFYYNDQELEKAFYVLKSELDGVELSESEKLAVENYVSSFENAKHVIDNSGYNDAVREFYRDEVYQFPAEFFYYNSPFFIDTPSYFGEMWY